MQADEASSRFSNLEATGAKGIFLRRRSLPILVGLALLTATLILWQALLAQEHTDTQQAIQLEAANAKFEITRQLQERTQGLGRMAKRWETQGKPPREYWEADARSYIEDYGGFQAIEWADPSFHIRWIVPLKGNEVAQNLNLNLDLRRRMALEAARNQHQITLTRTINLKQGGQGFLVYVPISQEQNFDGFIVGVFHTQEFLDNIFNDLDKRVGRKYGLTIFDGDEKIYSHYLSNPINEKKWGQDTSISFNGVTWRMRVWPEQALLAKQHSPLPTVTLISGLLMAILLPLAIDLAQVARRRAKKVATVNQELEAEIVQRQQVEEALNRHAHMLDLANDTIMIRDLEDSITYWNQGAERLYGWKKEEVVGQFVHTFLQTEFPKPLEEIRDVFLRHGYWEGELVHIKRDGTRVTVESRWTLQRDEQGQPSAILEINNDITERKQAEKRLEVQYITARVLAESATLSEATPKILQAICDSLGWDVGELWSVNQQANVLDFVTAWYQPSVKVPEFEAVTRSITFAPGVGLPGRVWNTGEPVWTADVLQDSNFLRAAVAEKAGLHGAFGFPILNTQEVLCVITFFSREIRQPDNDLLEMVTAIGRQIGQFIERKQAEDVLEQQRQWLQVTLCSIGDGVIATDTAAKITFMNPVAEALTGWTIQDALGRKIDEVFCIIHEYTRQAAEIPVERALREGIVVELAENTALITRDGREIPIDDSCASIRNKNGILQGTVLIFRDITKRKQAEKALQQAKAQLQAVLDAVPGCISWINSSLDYLGVNRQLAAICNLSPENFVDQKIGFLNSNYEFAEQVRAFFASPDPETSFEVGIEVDNSPQTYLLIAQKYAQNQAAVFVGIDITQRKWMEEALRISSATNRALINAIPDLLFRISRDGIFVNYKATNPSELLVPPREFIGKRVDDVLPEEVAQPTLQYVEQAFQTGQIQSFEYQLQLNGNLSYWEARLVVSGDNEVMAIVRDITKRKQAEEDIRKALAQEKELNELKSRFVSMTSHEFRTPLTTILGSSELLEYYSKKWTEEKKISHLHRIQTNVKRLTHLLDDVLLIGKADAGRLDFKPESINLEQFCLNLVEELQLSLSNQHTLTFVSQGQCTDACMDERLLRHIFSNLLSNAIKYSPAGGTVHFELTCQKREAIFRIRDEGIGIPPEDLERLFESFHRATNVGQIAGTGLGLAIVKRSVDLHGGKISVNSEVGVGTTFIVTIPLNKER